MMKKSFYAENLHKGFSIAILLSCAGRLEREAGRPAAGQTGKNLDIILKMLGLSRTCVVINNASDKVFFAAKDGRTEAKFVEVLSSRNIKRLERELLPGVKIIIAMGRNAYKAAMALQRLHPELIVIKARHPGFSSLNRIKVDCWGEKIDAGTPDATTRRAGVVVAKINGQTDYFLKRKKNIRPCPLPKACNNRFKIA